MTKFMREYWSIKNSKMMIHIEYETPYSKGTMEIKESYYLKIIKRFNRLFKNVIIKKFDYYEVNEDE